MELWELQELLEPLPECVVILEAGKLASANEAAKAFYGESLLYTPPAQLFGPLLAQGRGSAAGTVSWNGRSYPAWAWETGALRVITVQTARPQEPPELMARALGTLNSLASLNLLTVRRLYETAAAGGDVAQELDVCARASTGIARTVSSLMLLRDTEAGQLSLNRTAFDLVELVAGVVAAVSALLPADRCPILWSSEAEHFLLYGDDLLIRRMVLNLLANGLRYGTEPRLRLRLARCRGGVLLQAGEGCLPDLVREEEPSGTPTAGLGLPVIRAIAAAHGGSVTLGTSEGTAAVTVFLPHRDIPDGALRDARPAYGSDLKLVISELWALLDGPQFRDSLAIEE